MGSSTSPHPAWADTRTVSQLSLARAVEGAGHTEVTSLSISLSLSITTTVTIIIIILIIIIIILHIVTVILCPAQLSGRPALTEPVTRPVRGGDLTQLHSAVQSSLLMTTPGEYFTLDHNIQLFLRGISPASDESLTFNITHCK